MKRLMLPFILLSMVACQKSGDTKLNLPSAVPQSESAPPPAAVGSFVKCYADHGHGPSKYIHFPEDGTKNNVCFRDGVCFYGC